MMGLEVVWRLKNVGPIKQLEKVLEQGMPQYPDAEVRRSRAVARMWIDYRAQGTAGMERALRRRRRIAGWRGYKGIFPPATRATASLKSGRRASGRI